jgi:RimJ/RimL family protein N-acetyltransferase
MNETVFGPVRIETERLVLDGPALEDFEPLVAMWADPETTRHVGGPRSQDDSWLRLLRQRGLWHLLGYGYWTVREKETGRFAGNLGFADYHRDLEPAFDCAPEAGWVFAGWARGRGYAREALGVALAWFDGRFGGECHCLIDPENDASLRLAALHGFAAPRSVQFKQAPTLLLTRQRPSVAPNMSTR